MNNVKQEILEAYYPNYNEFVDFLDKYTEFELNLIQELPEITGDLEIYIEIGVQQEILYYVVSEYINSVFFDETSDELTDFFSEEDNLFITYEDDYRGYRLDSNKIKSLLKRFIEEELEDESIKVRNGNLDNLVKRLNKCYPIKFFND